MILYVANKVLSYSIVAEEVGEPTTATSIHLEWASIKIRVGIHQNQEHFSEEGSSIIYCTVVQYLGRCRLHNRFNNNEHQRQDRHEDTTDN